MGDELVGLDVTSDPTKFAHFATFPRALVEPLIKSSTSEAGCCSKCGKQWTRRVERNGKEKSGHQRGSKASYIPGRGDNVPKLERWKTATLGFAAACTCAAEVVPAVVLDIFAGSGTTLAVARDLGRRSIGIELSPEYAEMCVKFRILGAPYKTDDRALEMCEESRQAGQLQMEEEWHANHNSGTT